MNSNLAEKLSTLASALPAGSVFEFEEAESDCVFLRRLFIPLAHRGIGTGFLASVLATCDTHSVSTHLQADPTDVPSDPSTFDLVRWYMRFGFEVENAADDAIRMTRQHRDASRGLQGIFDDYDEAKENDLTQAQFEVLLSPPSVAI